MVKKGSETRPGAGGDKPSSQGERGPEEPAEAQAPRVTPEAETPTERLAEPVAEKVAERRPEGLGRYVLTAGISAAVLLFALAFFMAGFAAHALLDEDDDDGGGGDGATAANASDDDPFWGPEDAAVIIEEFADFECPFCGRHAAETLPQIKEAYGDRVRYIYRDFPLTNMHQFAQKAAEASQCAHEQGQFWEYHDLLFENQGALAVPNLKAYAEQVGADTEEFNDCLDSGKNAPEVLLDLQDGQQAGVSGTPAFLINDLLLSGAQPFEQFQVVIDQALAVGE
jgi:protein-disulfide isomerase